MVTAKEIKKSMEDFLAYDCDTTKWQNEVLWKQLNQLCDQLCREQRESCAKRAREWRGKVVADVVLNAKQPEL